MYNVPLVGAIVTIFGLCFPVVSVYDGISIWLWGFYTIEHKSLNYFRINQEKEFETFLHTIRPSNFIIFLLMLLCLIFIIQISIKLKIRRISLKEAKEHWVSKSLSLIVCLVIYMIIIAKVTNPRDFHYKIGIFIQFLGVFICLIPSFSTIKKHIFKINEHLTLKLENYETVIYIAGEPFEICKHLIINIPVEQVKNIESIDEAVDGYGDDIEDEFFTHEVDITPKELFKGHCSNLQVWTENNYDTCLLRNNLAFPLLKQLTDVGDLKALSVFKDEIRKRFRSLYAPIQHYLIHEGYLKYFSKSEKDELLEYVLSVDSWVLIGKNYSLDSQEDEAIKAYEYALKIDPINKNILKRLCSLSIAEEDYQKAFKYYKLLSELYGLRNHDYLAFGDIYNKLGQYKNAIKMYRCALQQKDLNLRSQALLKLGDFYFCEQEIDRAKRLYRDAIELNHNDVRAWIKLSDLLQREGKVYPAIETLKEGLKYEPHNTILLFQLRLLYKTNKNFWEYFKISIIYLIYKNKKRIVNIFKRYEPIRNLSRGIFTGGTETETKIDFEATKEKILSY